MAITDLVRKWWIQCWDDLRDDPHTFLELANKRYVDAQSKINIDGLPSYISRTKMDIIDELRPLAEQRLKEMEK